MLCISRIITCMSLLLSVSFGHMEGTFSYHYTLCVLSVDSVSTETVNNLFLYGERL